MAVFPTNDSALVNKLGEILGVDLDVVISLNNLDGISSTAQKHLDLTGPSLPTTPPPVSPLCSISSPNACEMDPVISPQSLGISAFYTDFY